MDNLYQFLSDQSVIIVAIMIVVTLIVQEILSEKKSAHYALSPEEAAVMVFKGAKIFDLRDKEDYRKGHIERAVNQKPKALELRPEKIMQPKQTYIFYCHNGHLSSELAQMLRQKNGFQTYYLQQGVDAWIEAGFALTTRTSS
jgi:rhodanese-related sulfurtransferase